MMPDEVIESTITSEGHYVYQYLDRRDKVRYVGYGRLNSRATSHSQSTHNPRLEAFIADEKFKIRIAGPYGTEEAGKAVETVLISVLKPDFNVAEGPSRWRFRPLGIPAHLAERIDLDFLGRSDLLAIQGLVPTPVLFVRVGQNNFPDGRVGYDPSELPSDQQIRERVDRYWQLANYLPEWSKNPGASPGLLVGIHGSPGAQFIIASLRIAQDKWSSTQKLINGRVQVPLKQCDDLDAFGIRGRQISRQAGLKFGALRPQFYIILGIDGSLRGGQT